MHTCTPFKYNWVLKQQIKFSYEKTFLLHDYDIEKELQKLEKNFKIFLNVQINNFFRRIPWNSVEFHEDFHDLTASGIQEKVDL